MVVNNAKKHCAQAESKRVERDERNQVKEGLPRVEVGMGTGHCYRKVHFREGPEGGAQVLLLPASLQEHVPDGFPFQPPFQGLLYELPEFFVHTFACSSLAE